MATFVKPSARFQTPDWFTSNYMLSTNAERERNASHDTRQEARFLRNETDNKTAWDQLDNNSRIADRVTQIRDLKALLERTVADLDREIMNLNDAKDQMEQALDQRVGLAKHINVENLVAREGRTEIDVVEDLVEVQLFKERELIEGIIKQLQSKIDQAFEHQCVLQDLRQQLVTDLQSKNITLDIDVEQYNLTTDSTGITFKPDPLRRPKGTLTVKQWQDFCHYNRERADKEMCNSVRLRESILSTLQQVSSDLQAQHIASAFELRHRVHEYNMSLDELKYQKKLTEEEMAEAEAEIRRLQEAIRVKTNFRKLAHTRLENRMTRPYEEMCQDNVQYGLQDEVKQLAASTQALQEKLRQTQHALHCMEQNLHRLNEDIERKQNSLNIDQQCIESRTKLLPVYPLTATDLNKQLTGMLRSGDQILPY